MIKLYIVLSLLSKGSSLSYYTNILSSFVCFRDLRFIWASIDKHDSKKKILKFNRGHRTAVFSGYFQTLNWVLASLRNHMCLGLHVGVWRRVVRLQLFSIVTVRRCDDLMKSKLITWSEVCISTSKQVALSGVTLNLSSNFEPL
jgi:hypothetical protein